MFLRKKLSEKLLVVIFAALILFDLVGVDRRYVNNENFVSSIEVNKPYQPNAADLEIMNDKGHFRVFDVVSREPGKAAYFHNSLSGYHAAKLGRYDELFDFYIARNNIHVLNMLNTKYIIADDKGKIFAYENTDANGNAWFVNNVEKLNSANAEMKALDSLDTRSKAVTTQSISTKNYRASQCNRTSCFNDLRLKFKFDRMLASWDFHASQNIVDPIMRFFFSIHISCPTLSIIYFRKYGKPIIFIIRLIL